MCLDFWTQKKNCCLVFSFEYSFLWIFNKIAIYIYILKICIYSFYMFCLPNQNPLIIVGVQLPRRKIIITSCSNMENITNLNTSSVFAPAQVHNADRGKNVAEFGIKWPGQATLICYWICVNMTRISRRHKTWKQCFNIYSLWNKEISKIY